VICDLDRSVMSKILPRQGGTVSSVAFSPDGQILAIGTGSYSVTGDPQRAQIEFWALSASNVPEYRSFTALPGVCVDAITWRNDGDRVACATGLRSQKGGYIAQVDASQLRPFSFFETSWTGSGRLCYLDRESPGSHLGVAFHGEFRVVNSQDGKEALRADRSELPDLLQDFDHDPENQELVLTSGVVINPFDGDEKNRFLVMKDCTSIAFRPGGGYLGASNRGKIYCWR
jgi:hypothetical protein